MNNPFVKKNDSTFWIIAGVIGAFAAGAVAYLYIKEKGFTLFGDDEEVAENPEHEVPAYMQKHGLKKKHKTDLRDLDSIIHHEQ